MNEAVATLKESQKILQRMPMDCREKIIANIRKKTMENAESAKQAAYDLALKYESTYGGCSQCVLAAIKDTVGGDKVTDEVFRAAARS